MPFVIQVTGNILVGIKKILMEFSVNMKLQIGDWTVYTALLVYFNSQDLCSDSLYQMTSYCLDQKFAKQMWTIKILKLL